MKYTLKSITEAYNNFIRTNEHEPTAIDFDNDPTLPGARYIQRNYGGLRNLRKELGSAIIDHTTGETRKKAAKAANERCKLYEAELSNAIYKKLHDQQTFNPAVIRQFAYQQYIEKTDDYENISCDVAISYRDPSHVILIDFFYPSTIHSLSGCVRSKTSKLRRNPPKPNLYDCTHEVVFVCVNPDFNQDTIDSHTTNCDFTVQSLATFKGTHQL